MQMKTFWDITGQSPSGAMKYAGHKIRDSKLERKKKFPHLTQSPDEVPVSPYTEDIPWGEGTLVYRWKALVVEDLIIRNMR